MFLHARTNPISAVHLHARRFGLRNPAFMLELKLMDKPKRWDLACQRRSEQPRRRRVSGLINPDRSSLPRFVLGT